MGKHTGILSKGDRRNPPAPRRTSATRVMLVDDSLTVRSAMSRIIENEPDLEVVAKTSSAELALTELKRTAVDVVLLDLEMPGMGGLGALPKILASRDGIEVLVVSSLAGDGAEHTLQALSMGAADTMLKPQSGGFDEQYYEALFAKIRALGPSEAHRSNGQHSHVSQSTASGGRVRPEVIAIGASTGGIHAMCQFLANLAPQVHAPILVTQHLPESFMDVFARQLELASSRRAVIAADGARLEYNTIYVAPGNGHLNIRSIGNDLVGKITHEGVTSGCMPSVDPMLSSAASATKGKALAVILSGMGKDGADGARALSDAGGVIMVQDKESSAVWGMPGAAVESGVTSAILPPAELAEKISAMFGASAWK